MVNGWRDRPELKQLFHPDYPDDLQVLIHNGGPRLTQHPPECCWVRVTAVENQVFRGRLLNQPQNLQTIRQGDELLFIIAQGCDYPIRVSERYLRERGDWDIYPCDRCGLSELFDAPSDLIRVVFPNSPAGAVLQQFTSFCPICGGVQLVAFRSTADQSQTSRSST